MPHRKLLFFAYALHPPLHFLFHFLFLLKLLFFSAGFSLQILTFSKEEETKKKCQKSFMVAMTRRRWLPLLVAPPEKPHHRPSWGSPDPSASTATSFGSSLIKKVATHTNGGTARIQGLELNRDLVKIMK